MAIWSLYDHFTVTKSLYGNNIVNIYLSISRNKHVLKLHYLIIDRVAVFAFYSVVIGTLLLWLFFFFFHVFLFYTVKLGVQ